MESRPNETPRDESVEPLLEAVDPEKRALLKRIIVGTAFAAPLVASFSMEGLSPHEAFAQSSNLTVIGVTFVLTTNLLPH